MANLIIRQKKPNFTVPWNYKYKFCTIVSEVSSYVDPVLYSILSFIYFYWLRVFTLIFWFDNNIKIRIYVIKIEKINNVFLRLCFIITGEFSSKTNIWPISNTECKKWVKSAKISFSSVYIFKSKPSWTKLHHTFIKNG